MEAQLGVFLFLLVCVYAAQKNILKDPSLEELMKNPDWVSLVEKSSRARALKANDPVQDEECPAVYSCKDCKTSRVCKPMEDGSLKFVHYTPCTGPTPYCSADTGTCVSEVTEECGTKDDDFICMGVQKYPDDNCKNFHVCDKTYQAYKFECLVDSENYNAVTGSCDSSAPCGQFDCQNSQGTKVAHSDFKGYFAYCQEEGKTLVVDSCKGDYELNMTSQVCEPVCKKEGLVQDLDDCHGYYQCTNIFISKGMSYMNREKKSCPVNQGFSPKAYMCVDITQLPECPAK